MTEGKVKVFFNRLEYLKNSSDRILIRSKIVQRFLGDIHNVNILDIGCGDGSLSLPLLDETNRLTLVDIADRMLGIAKSNIPGQLLKNVNLVNDSFEAISDHEKFDVILCVGVIAHVPDVNRLFEKISRLLKPGGFLIIETTPNPYPLGKLLFPYYLVRGWLSGSTANYNKNRLKVVDLLNYATAMGLSKLQAVRFSFPLPGMSHWSQALKLRYTLFTLNNRWMSRLGSEHIMLFQRVDSASI
jgi:2-polyprenyl-3-methyl-5-hydroxy-6-metoxy-1,4-benzoquinol methylase